MTPLVCPACGQPTIPGKPFCAECGAALPLICAACGQPLAPGKRFCADCGAPVPAASTALPAPTAPPALEAHFSAFQHALPPTLHAQIFTPEVGENRVLTILFVDLSGSVRATVALHPEDAADLLQGVLQEMVDAVLAHDGRINQVLGDAVLALFGTPHAHENDPERAVRAAVQIHAAVQQRGANVTAGINTGEVYLGTVEQGPQQQVRAGEGRAASPPPPALSSPSMEPVDHVARTRRRDPDHSAVDSLVDSVIPSRARCAGTRPW